MFEYIRPLSHKSPLMSHCAFLYQDVNTKKYYLSHQLPSEPEKEDATMFLLLKKEPQGDNERIGTRMTDIGKCVEVTRWDFIAGQKGDYLLDEPRI